MKGRALVKPLSGVVILQDLFLTGYCSLESSAERG